MLPAELSRVLMEMPLRIPLTIGKSIVTTLMMMVIVTSSVSAASIQSGAFLPLIFSFFRRPITGFPTSDTTTAMSTYISTLLKYQHRPAIMAAPAAIIKYLASLSVYLSFCSI